MAEMLHPVCRRIQCRELLGEMFVWNALLMGCLLEKKGISGKSQDLKLVFKVKTNMSAKDMEHNVLVLKYMAKGFFLKHLLELFLLSWLWIHFTPT